MTVSIIGFTCLLILILLRAPISFAMGFVGFFGFLFLIGNLNQIHRTLIVAYFYEH